MPRNKLAEIRRAQSKTLLDFYNQTAIPVYHLSDIERGKVLPVVSEMKVLTQLYGIAAQEIWDIVDPVVGQIGSIDNPFGSIESQIADGRLCCMGCYTDNPGDSWFWTPVRQSEHAERACERCGKKLVE